MDEMEKKIILNTLDKINWNKTKAAELLGVNRSTLISKLSNQSSPNTRSLEANELQTTLYI
jgi:DNA-binding NtrC family response regulator